MKRAHLVGNGPSYKKFVYKEDDFVLACNVPKVVADATLLSDLRIAYKVREKVVSIDCPVIVNKKVQEWLETRKGQQAGLLIMDTYARPAGTEPMDMSSGHYGLLWLIEQGYEEIHVWGCDSIFEGHIYSHTDDIVYHAAKQKPEHNAKCAGIWKAKFYEIRDANPDRTIIFHEDTSTE